MSLPQPDRHSRLISPLREYLEAGQANARQSLEHIIEEAECREDTTIEDTGPPLRNIQSRKHFGRSRSLQLVDLLGYRRL